MALSYNLAYQEIISVHPTRRQIFADKSDSVFWNIWQWVIYKLINILKYKCKDRPHHDLRLQVNCTDRGRGLKAAFIFKPLSEKIEPFGIFPGVHHHYHSQKCCQMIPVMIIINNTNCIFCQFLSSPNCQQNTFTFKMNFFFKTEF